MALEFDRLHQAGMKRKELELQIDFWKAKPKKLHDFRRDVTTIINSMGQSLLEIFDRQSELIARRRNVRATFQSEIIGHLHRFEFYWQRAVKCFEDGNLGKPNSPFSEASVVRIYRKQIGHMEDVYTHLKSFLPKRELKKIEQILVSTKLVLSVMEERIK